MWKKIKAWWYQQKCQAGKHKPKHKLAYLKAGPGGTPLYMARDCIHCTREEWAVGSPDIVLPSAGALLATCSSGGPENSIPHGPLLPNEGTVLKGEGDRILQREGWLLVDSYADYRRVLDELDRSEPSPISIAAAPDLQQPVRPRLG